MTCEFLIARLFSRKEFFMSADVIMKTMFFIHGQNAPKGSEFKGTITHESLFGGFFNYTARKDATKESVDKEEKKSSMVDYTSRNKAIMNSSANGEYFTMSNEGKLFTEEERNEWREHSKDVFTKDNEIAWQLIVSLDSKELLEHYMITDQNDMASIAKLALYKSFSKLHMNPNNFVWWEDYHTNTNHPHMHITFCEKEQTREKGKFTKKEMAVLKTTFFKELLSRKQTYESSIGKDVSKYNLKDIEPLRKNVVSKSKVLEDLSYETLQNIADLYAQLPAGGRLQYGSSNMIPYRKQLDAIVDGILMCESVKVEYDTFKDRVQELENNINKMGNEKVSSLVKSEDTKVRKQIANAILGEFKTLGVEGIAQLCSMKSWQTDRAKIILDEIANDVINNEKATDIEKNIANTLIDGKLEEAEEQLQNLDESSELRIFLNDAIKLAKEKDAERILELKKKLFDSSEKGNKYSKKYVNYSKHGYPINKKNFSNYRKYIQPMLMRRTRKLIMQNAKEIENEIDAYLHKDDDIAVESTFVEQQIAKSMEQ